MDQLLQLIFNGIVSGSIIAIASVGASLVWGVLRIGNFAHGDYLAVGAFSAYFFDSVLGLHLAVAAAGAILVTAAFAVIADRLILYPMRGKSLTSVFILTVGLGFVLKNVLFMIFGAGGQRFSLDQAEVLLIGPLRVSPGQAIAVVATTIAIALVAWLLAATNIGRSMRAVSENPELAAVTGVNTERLASMTWFLAGGLAGLGGVCIGLVQGTFDANMGTFFLFLIFTAVVLGGIGSAYGALVGGLVLGLAMEVSTWDGFAGGLDSRYKLVLAFGALIFLLLFRPQGIFGKTRLL